MRGLGFPLSSQNTDPFSSSARRADPESGCPWHYGKLDGIASGANNYSLPVASSSARGGIRTGYPSTRNERAVLLSSERAYVQIQNADHNGAGLMTSGDKIILDQLAKIRAVGMYQFQSNGTTYSSFGMTIYSNKGYASDGTICIDVYLTGGDTSKVYYPIAMAPIGYTVSISGRAAGGQVISLSFRKIGGGVEVPNGGYLYLFEAN